MHLITSTLATALYLSSVVLATPLATRSLKARAGSSVTGWEYSGCYSEATEQRALTGSHHYNDLLTVQLCATFCSNGGFPVFGTLSQDVIEIY